MKYFLVILIVLSSTMVFAQQRQPTPSERKLDNFVERTKRETIQRLQPAVRPYKPFRQDLVYRAPVVNYNPYNYGYIPYNPFSYYPQYISDFDAYNYGNRIVGYQPIITWLPQGVSLGTSAVISPDRRYVRIGVSPMFSTVGPVQTYNFSMGQSRIGR